MRTAMQRALANRTGKKAITAMMDKAFRVMSIDIAAV